ncbi:hypothetical protein NOH58_24645, partial [Escherichia coli]|nr:hypothetical protein [Escherichia coli]
HAEQLKDHLFSVSILMGRYLQAGPCIPALIVNWLTSPGGTRHRITKFTSVMKGRENVECSY